MSKKLSLVMTLLFALSGVSLAQHVTQLLHPAPDGAIVEYLLTDGTVMVQGNSCSDWWKLTPTITGSYDKGTWTQLASLPSGYSPYATSGAVLADGRFLLTGGEYSNCGAQPPSLRRVPSVAASPGRGFCLSCSSRSSANI